jgi:ribA/ribD-fused uncharacterized protein
MPPVKKTKPWNTNTDELSPDETIYIDYNDETKEDPCCAKFKTNRVSSWISAHRHLYHLSNLSNKHTITWEEKNNITQVRIKKSRTNHLVVKFYPTTGIVLAQSKDFLSWANTDAPQMRDMMQQNIIKVAQNEENDTVENDNEHDSTESDDDSTVIMAGCEFGDTTPQTPQTLKEVDDDILALVKNNFNTSTPVIKEHSDPNQSQTAMTAPLNSNSNSPQTPLSRGCNASAVRQQYIMTPMPDSPTASTEGKLQAPSSPVSHSHSPTPEQQATDMTPRKGKQKEGQCHGGDKRLWTMMSALTGQVQGLENKIVEVIEGFRTDSLHSKLQATKKEATDYKREWEMSKKEATKWENECNRLQSTPPKDTESCSMCNKLTNKLGDSLIQTEKVEKQLTAAQEKITNLVQTNELLLNQSQGWREKCQEVEKNIEELRVNLLSERQKHIAWTIQAERRIEEMADEKENLSSVNNMKAPSYSEAATSRPTTDITDIQANRRTRNMYHLSDILCVQGVSDPLSNFYRLESPILKDNIEFRTLEHLYQYLMSKDHNKENVAIAIANLIEPSEAKEYADRHIPRQSDAWLKKKRSIMAELLEEKFDASPTFRAKLLQSGNKSLLHTVSSAFWGIGLHTAQIKNLGYVKKDQIRGEDQFGLLLEELRAKKRAASTTTNACKLKPPQPAIEASNEMHT